MNREKDKIYWWYMFILFCTIFQTHI